MCHLHFLLTHSPPFSRLQVFHFFLAFSTKQWQLIVIIKVNLRWDCPIGSTKCSISAIWWAKFPFKDWPICEVKGILSALISKSFWIHSMTFVKKMNFSWNFISCYLKKRFVCSHSNSSEKISTCPWQKFIHSLRKNTEVLKTCFGAMYFTVISSMSSSNTKCSLQVYSKLCLMDQPFENY